MFAASAPPDLLLETWLRYDLREGPLPAFISSPEQIAAGIFSVILGLVRAGNLYCSCLVVRTVFGYSKYSVGIC